jgi:septal ring factor EnvC (AmiA/AmiB activator)
MAKHYTNEKEKTLLNIYQTAEKDLNQAAAKVIDQSNEVGKVKAELDAHNKKLNDLPFSEIRDWVSEKLILEGELKALGSIPTIKQFMNAQEIWGQAKSNYEDYIALDKNEHKAFLERALVDWKSVLDQENISPQLRKEISDLISNLNKDLDDLSKAEMYQSKAEVSDNKD